MSRQRIRASVLESSTDTCPHCGGTGHVRSVSSVALQLLRVIEETLLRGATHNLVVRTRTEVALYVLNHKRGHLRDLEERFQITITVNADAAMAGQQPFLIEKGEQVHSPEQARAIAAQPATVAAIEAEHDEESSVVEEEEVEAEGEVETIEAAESEELEEVAGEARPAPGDDEPRRRRRRRRGRRGGEVREPRQFTHETVPEHVVEHEEDAEALPETGEGETPVEGAPDERQPLRGGNGEHEDGRRPRRRGRRGGRRNRRGREGEALPREDVEEVAFGEPAPVATAVEPEVAAAVADLGGAPASVAPIHEEVHHEPPPAPSEPEPPRRRSTVREPVAFLVESGTAAPAEIEPQPVPAQPTSPSAAEAEAPEAADKPRRTGWWAKRLMGKG